ncbi:MAG: efflux transporter outer membrane subunit [Steroidobacteraceae bacterium]|jgi:NodT family efflux transporter outer membrane factor (OMF) lipoprotein
MKSTLHGLRHLTVLVLAIGSLTACAAGPNFVAPKPPSEKTYTAAPVQAFGSAGPLDPEQRLAIGTSPRADWWTSLRSPELDQVVELALKNNPTLEIARANLASAAEMIAAANGQRYPQIDSVSSVGRTRYGAAFLGPEGRTYPVFSAYSMGVDVKYDFDIFGGVKRGVEQASAAAAYQREQLNAAQLSVSGNAVLQALQIAALRAQIAVVQHVLESDEKTLALVQHARAAGVVSDIDVLSARSQRDSDRTLLPPLRQQLNVAQDALAVLIGRSPASWSAPDFALERLNLPVELRLSLPSELVRVRPDIRAAEAQLHEASAAVGVATADMYPRLTLNAGLAEQGIISGGTAPAWSLLGGLTAPIFHGGTLSAKRRAAEDAYRAAFANYQQTVIASFGQVADTLHGLQNDADSLQSQQQALASADSALELVRQGYKVGNAGIVQILTAQRLQQLAELGLVQARAQRYADTVKLCLASGGGVI